MFFHALRGSLNKELSFETVINMLVSKVENLQSSFGLSLL
jgi:hypothetical protein